LLAVYTASMTTDVKVKNLSDNIFISLLHSANICYFALLTGNLLHKSLLVHIDQLHYGSLDILVLIFFFLGAISYSSSYLLGKHLVSSIDRVGVIMLIWGSAVPFIYFQFYYDKWVLLIILAIITFAGARCAASVLYGEDETHQRFCLGFGLYMLAPAMYGCFGETHCRHPLALDYVKYIGSSGIGVLASILKFPENLAIHSSFNGRFVMHVILVGAAIVYSEKLMTAYSATPMDSSMKCREWMR
jgi:hypothetical protein